MKKKDKINQILDELTEYSVSIGFAYTDNITSLRKQYSLNKIVGLFENFLKDVYNNNKLEEYFDSEIIKYNSICGLIGFETVNFTEEQKQFILNKITEICKIIL